LITEVIRGRIKVSGQSNIAIRFIPTIRNILAVLMVCCVSLSSAQTTKITGKVIDAETGESLPFVNITFQDSKIGTSSDIDGNYSIESYYATDSLVASFVGYKKLTMKVRKDETQKIDFAMMSSTFDLPDVVIIAPEEDPAYPIMRRVVRNKPANNKEKLESFQYEIYNKIEFDMNNITDKFKERKLFRKFDFVFDNIDTTGKKPFLPVFLSESISDFYYRKSPKKEKEFIKGTKVTGIRNNSVSQFLGDMYQDVNIYRNHVSVFGKNFISPVANNGKAYYKYYLMDSTYIDGDFCYQIRFMPRRKQELTFIGDLWVNDTTYAIRVVEGSIVEDANINFVNDLWVRQEFEQVEKEVWMMVKEQMSVDFNLTDGTMGFYGKKTATFKDFVINKPKEDEFYEGAENIIVADDVNEKTDEFWDENRHDTLTENELVIYHMIDTLENLPIVKTYVDVITTILSGYKILGPVELGPYFSMYSYNPIEGHRFRLGGRTSNAFSKMVEFSGYTAYGTRDEKFKYGLGTRFFITKDPRQMVRARYVDDIEQIGLSQNAFRKDNVLSSFARRNPANKLTKVTDARLSYEREWFKGFSSMLQFRTTDYSSPNGSAVPFMRENEVGESQKVNNIRTSEVSFYTRLAYKEQFLSGEFERISLSTKFPIIETHYTIGLKDVFNSQYEYQKLVLGIKHKFSLGYLGNTHYYLEAGKIWGQLPYPLLEIHAGNETWSYNENSYNAMNIMEFVSDQYASVFVTHHFDGLFLNKIPLMKKLKWREVASVKAVIGSMSDKHKAEMVLPEYTRTLEKPYIEAALGIENIFKILRIDALWRVTHLDNTHPDIGVLRFGIRGKLQVDF
jgi:hypothetical protein